MEETDIKNLKKYCANNLKQSLQALALSAEEQLKIFPGFVVVADELALNFSDAYVWAVGNKETGVNGILNEDISEKQKQLLEFLDCTLDKMSGEERAVFWTEEALRERKEWQEIRNIALNLLTEFGWPLEKPIFDAISYIGHA